MNYDYHNQIPNNTGVSNTMMNPQIHKQNYNDHSYIIPNVKTQPQQPPMHIQQSNAMILSKLRRRLNVYIMEYLKKQNYFKTASLFEQEVNYSNPQEMGDSFGFLFEWFCLFYSLHGQKIYKSNPGMRPSQEINRGQVFQNQSGVQPPLNPSKPVYNIPMDTSVYDQGYSMNQSMGSYPTNDGYSRNVYQQNAQSSDHYRRYSGSNLPIQRGNISDESVHTMNMHPSNIDMRNYNPSNGNLHQMNRIHPSHDNNSMMGYSQCPDIRTETVTAPITPNDTYKFTSQPPSPHLANYNNPLSPVSPNSIPESKQHTIRMKEVKKKVTAKKLKIKKDPQKNVSPTNTSFSQVSTPSSDLSHGMEYGNDEYSSSWSNQSKSTTIYPYTPTNYPNINSPETVSKMPHSYSPIDKDSNSSHPQQGYKKRKSSDYSETSDLIHTLDQKTPSNENPDFDSQSFIVNPMDNSFDDIADLFEEDVVKNTSQMIKELKVLKVDDGPSKITCSNFNRTGEILATGTSQSSINIWNTKTGLLNTSLEHCNYITSVCFSPTQNNVLASSSLDGSLRLWNLSNNTSNSSNHSVKLFKSKEYGPIPSIDFHPKNENLLCSSDSSGNLRLWDTRKEDFIQVIKDAASKQTRFSSKGDRLATGISNLVKIYDIETSKLLFDISGHVKPIQSIYWSDNDSTLISTSEDSVKVWKMTSLSSNVECIGSFSQSGNKKYYAVPHPSYSESHVIIGAYKSMYIWDYSMTRQIHDNYIEINNIHDGIVSSLSTFGKSMLASTSHDSTAKLWSVGEE